jgi:hypothetical protein
MDIMVKMELLDRMMAYGLTVWESRILAAILAQGIIVGSMDSIVIDSQEIAARIQRQLERAGEPVPVGISVQLSNGIPRLIEKGFLISGGKQGRKFVVSVVAAKAGMQLA